MGIIVAAGFLKLVTTSVSLGFGFVGGQIFPLVFAGTCMGVVVNMLVERVPAAGATE
jgi:H+/Cl- antiporter ClcA